MHNEFNQKKLLFSFAFFKSDTGSPTGQFFMFLKHNLFRVSHTIVLNGSPFCIWPFFYLFYYRLNTKFVPVSSTKASHISNGQGKEKISAVPREIEIGRGWTHFFLAHILINCVKMSRLLMNGLLRFPVTLFRSLRCFRLRRL
jgi:hypothetical protein